MLASFHNVKRKQSIKIYIPGIQKIESSKRLQGPKNALTSYYHGQIRLKQLNGDIRSLSANGKLAV